jgi:hypothetical protein
MMFLWIKLYSLLCSFQQAQDHQKWSPDAKVIIVFVLLALSGWIIRAKLGPDNPGRVDYPAKNGNIQPNNLPQNWTACTKSLVEFRGGRIIRSKLGLEYPALQNSNGYNPGRGINTPPLLQA